MGRYRDLHWLNCIGHLIAISSQVFYTKEAPKCPFNIWLKSLTSRTIFSTYSMWDEIFMPVNFCCTPWLLQTRSNTIVMESVLINKWKFTDLSINSVALVWTWYKNYNQKYIIINFDDMILKWLHYRIMKRFYLLGNYLCSDQN